MMNNDNIKNIPGDDEILYANEDTNEKITPTQTITLKRTLTLKRKYICKISGLIG